MAHPISTHKSAMALGHAEGKGVVLPDDAVTQGFAILARRRSGKSTLAGVIEETFCERGDPWVVLDPVSAHWGIRYQDENGQPGKPSGYDVMIVGGKYGDVALDERHGAALAQILVDTNISCVVDLGAESMNAQQKFVADFAMELLRINETPRHVLLEEAHTFVPQQPMFDNQKMALGALTKMITMGGGKGIGYSLITQRSAAIAKSVLEQIDNLFVLRMSGPRDLKAVQDWFEHNIGDNAEMKRVLGTLRAFEPGEAWWLSDTSLQRLRVRQRNTYHAGRTPKRGETMRAPKVVELREVIGKYRHAAEKRSIAIQQERDVKAENAELKKKLAAAEKSQRVEQVPCNHEGDIAALRVEIANGEREIETLEQRLTTIYQQVQDAQTDLALVQSGQQPIRAARARPEPTLATREVRTVPRREPAAGRNGREPQQRPPAISTNGHAPTGDLDGPERRILNALAWWEAIGVDAAAKGNVGFIAGYRVGKTVGGAFGNTLGRLRSRGLIDYPTPGRVALTGEGRAHAESPDIPPTTDALHEAIFAKLVGPERRVLAVAIEAHPEAIGKQEAGERAGYQVGPTIGGAYGNTLGRLRSLGLIDYPTPGYIAATSLLFPEGA